MRPALLQNSFDHSSLLFGKVEDRLPVGCRVTNEGGFKRLAGLRDEVSQGADSAISYEGRGLVIGDEPTGGTGIDFVGATVFVTITSEEPLAAGLPDDSLFASRARLGGLFGFRSLIAPSSGDLCPRRQM
jgi:hypothetical protein